MQLAQSGLRRYMYEFIVARTINDTSDSLDQSILVSQGRRLRDLMEERLREKGTSFDDPRLSIPDALGAIQSVMQDEVEGYEDIFTPADHTSRAYRMMFAQFSNGVGIKQGAREVTGEGRLPISPYDPRWAQRYAVKQAGSSIPYVSVKDIDTYAGGLPANLDKVRNPELMISLRTGEDQSTELGSAYSLDDVSGMTELMGRMSTQDYQKVRSWVIDGAYDPKTGRMSTDRFMSPEAIARSRAILDMMAEEGIPYTVEPDLQPGQIRARLTGTNMTVRLTDTRDKERWVGRVYDNGATIYFSSTARGSDRKQMDYIPTTDEVCDLIRVGLGRPVERKDGKGLVGHVNSRQVRGRNATTQDSYFSNNMMTSVYKDMPGMPGEKVVIRRYTKDRSASSQYFTKDETGAQRARAFLEDSIASARNNVQAQLNIDGLIQQFNEHADEAREGTYVPDFPGDPDLAGVAEAYWDVLRGAETTLLKPEATREEYAAATEVLDGMDEGSDLDGIHDMLAGSVAYTGSPEEKIRAHQADLLEVQFGNSVDTGFDPVRVGRYMSSEYGQWRNNDDLVAAMRAAGVRKEQILGDSFYSDSFRDRLIEFDESTAVPAEFVDDEFIRSMLDTVRESLEACAVTPGSIKVDHYGVVRWTGSVVRTQGGDERPIEGTIGQIFSRGPQGEIITQFNSGNNLMIVPGYEARIVAQKPGENKSLEERTRLVGYEQQMADAIRYQIQADVLSGRTEVGEPASLNSTYRRLTDTRHRADHYERSLAEGMEPGLLNAIVATESRRVRYPNSVRDGSTIAAEFRARKDKERHNPLADPANDATMDPWVLTGGRNMALLTEESDGYFDPIMTSGGTNQGVVRYLVEGAEVAPDGSIVPSEDKNDRTPLMKTELAQTMEFDPFDRQQMTTSNLMNASSVSKPSGTAFMTAGGWTMEDSIVISADFARENQVRGIDGEMRDLVVGDKLSDLHGNKGVISLIVDRDAQMSNEELERLHGSTEMMELFRNNPQLDVVMAPFSPVSRFNGGSAREGMQNAQSLNLPGGRGEVDGGLAEMSFIVTRMTADVKTRAYDEAAIRAGQGRKASSQLAWALQSQGCDKVLQKMYGSNQQATAEVREMMLVCGLDMDADGVLRVGRDDLAEGAERRLVEMGEVPVTDRGTFDVRKVREDFAQEFGDAGGDMEIPFPLTMPTGQRTEKATDSTWKIPVLSAHLRSGQDLDDGSNVVHDYTNRYLTIREWSMRYLHAQENIDSGQLDSDGLMKARKIQAEAVQRSQSAYDGITQDLMNRRFSGKRNVFREKLMSSRLARSATALWSGNPTLDIDQIGVGRELAKKLHLRDGDYALVWRDPILRDSGVRYMRVALQDDLPGVSINPNMVKCFDGDFDGDSVAVVNIGQKGPAHEQALERLSVEANMLDLGQGKDELGRHPLAMHDALDVKVSQYKDEGHQKAMEDILQRANDAHYDFVEEGGSREEFLAANRAVAQDASAMYRDALQHQYGDAVLSFNSIEDHVRSVKEACIDTGAKGSMPKVGSYCTYLGYNMENNVDFGVTQVTREDQEGTMYATAVKSHGTGNAGTFPQRGVKCLRNTRAMKAVLELTYPMTQALLQAKHDPVDAARRYELIMGPARDLWRGYMIEPAGNGEWRTVRDSKTNEPVRATADSWVEVAERFYGEAGLDVKINPENLHTVAEELVDERGLMRNIEDEDLIKEMASPMDQMAYGGDFFTLVKLAEKNENVFDGRWNSEFAPHKMREGAQAFMGAVSDRAKKVAANAAPAVKGFAQKSIGSAQELIGQLVDQHPAFETGEQPVVPVMKDTQQDGTTRRRRSSWATPVRSRAVQSKGVLENNESLSTAAERHGFTDVSEDQTREREGDGMTL